MCMLTISIKLAPMKRKSCCMIFSFNMLTFDVVRLPFFLLCNILERTGKIFFRIFFSIVVLEACEQYRKCFTGRSGKCLGTIPYYIVCMSVTYHVYCRNTTKARKQGYKITPDLCSSVQVTLRCVCAWNEIGLKVCIVYEVWF